MAKKATTKVAPVEVTDDLIALYDKKAEQQQSRKVSAGKNVPYGDVIELTKLLIPVLKEKGREITVSALKGTITDTLAERYNALPEGGDREAVRVGTEIVKMTRTELKQLRLEQLANSKKENMIYRYIYGYLKNQKKKTN